MPTDGKNKTASAYPLCYDLGCMSVQFMHHIMIHAVIDGDIRTSYPVAAVAAHKDNYRGNILFKGTLLTSYTNSDILDIPNYLGSTWYCYAHLPCWYECLRYKGRFPIRDTKSSQFMSSSTFLHLSNRQRIIWCNVPGPRSRSIVARSHCLQAEFESCPRDRDFTSNF